MDKKKKKAKAISPNDAIVESMLGPGSYNRKEKSRRGILYNMSEGEGAETDLRRGDTPSTIMKRYHGERKHDIRLKK